MLWELGFSKSETLHKRALIRLVNCCTAESVNSRVMETKQGKKKHIEIEWMVD